MSGLAAQSDNGEDEAEASRFTPVEAFDAKNEMLRSFLAQHDMLSGDRIRT